MKTKLFFFLLAGAICFTSCNQSHKNFATSSDGLQISYTDQGSGDVALVFVHGWSCDKSYWKNQVPEFSKKYRVVTVDYGGHGKSGTDRDNFTINSFIDDVVAVVDKLDLENVILIGHSMGGAIAILLTLKSLERVKHLLVIEPNLRAHDTQLSREIVKYIESEFIQHYREFQSSAIETVKHWFADFHQKNLDQYITDLLKTTPISMYRSAQSLMTTTRDELFLRQFQQLALPKHLLVGEETLKIRQIPEELATSNIKTIIVPGVGHMMMVENPAIFNHALAVALQ